MDDLYLFYFLLFIVAFLYSSVGHGGASGYLALMAIFGFAPDIMKPTALMLNLFVSLPVIRFFFFSNVDVKDMKPSHPWLSLVIGGGIGFLSGLIGIGGGIILSPILLLLKWTDQKQTAAISALFIFVNSLSGLKGQFELGVHFSADMYLFVVIAFTGGLLGAYFGALRFKQAILKNVLASVLLLAAYKLIFTHA